MQNAAYQQKFVQTVYNSLANDRLEVLDRKVTRPERRINAFVNDIRTDCGTSRVLRDDDIVDAVGAVVKSENCRKKLAHIHTRAATVWLASFCSRQCVARVLETLSNFLKFFFYVRDVIASIKCATVLHCERANVNTRLYGEESVVTTILCVTGEFMLSTAGSSVQSDVF